MMTSVDIPIDCDEAEDEFGGGVGLT